MTKRTIWHLRTPLWHFKQETFHFIHTLTHSAAYNARAQQQRKNMYRATTLINIALAALCISAAFARPDQYDAAAETRSYKSEAKEDGSYQYQYETSNGIAAGESGVGGYYASGSSAYYAPDGQLIQLTYTADENGFHPSGEHLPTPPPIPAAIVKALEYIRTHPHQEDRQGGGASGHSQQQQQQQIRQPLYPQPQAQSFQPSKKF